MDRKNSLKPSIHLCDAFLLKITQSVQQLQKSYASAKELYYSNNRILLFQINRVRRDARDSRDVSNSWPVKKINGNYSYNINDHYN